MKVSLAQILLNTLFIFVFLGCVNRQEPDSKVKQEVPPVLVESEMLAKVNECRVCHGTQEAQRGPILMEWNIGICMNSSRSFIPGCRGQNPKNRSNI
jgi:hypothetical protein